MLSHRKDEVILLAHGEYSDYRTGPMLRVLRDLDLGALAEEFYAQCPKDPYCDWEDRREADESTFAAWLDKNGWTEEMTYDEVHVGSYGEFAWKSIQAGAAHKSATIN